MRARRPRWLLELLAARTELAILAALAALITLGAVSVSSLLSSFHISDDCIGSWLSNPDPSGACAEAIRPWAELNDGIAGRLLLASSALPFLGGLVLGVVAVAREIESGTAEITWSLARSRRAWLTPRLGVLVVALLVLLVPIVLATSWLEDERTARGAWISPLADAAGFGLPILGHGLLGLAVGLLVGAVTGRQLPAILIGAALLFAVASIEPVLAGLYAPLPGGQQIGGPGFVESYLADPDVEARFVTRDGHMLSVAAARALVPANEPDPMTWLESNAAFVPLGISKDKTTAWQVVETATTSAVAVVTALIGAAVVMRRRPR